MEVASRSLAYGDCSIAVQNVVMSARDPLAYEIPQGQRAESIRRVPSEYLVVEPLEAGFARRFLEEGIRTFVEMGAASGPISRLLQPCGVRCIAVDNNPPPDAFELLIRADLRSVPLPADSVDAVSAVNCLYFLGDPIDGVREARRLLAPGRLFLASAPSRYHDSEIKDFIPEWGERSPFDAEEARGIVGAVFDDVDVQWWEVPAYILRSPDQVIDYFAMFGYPDPERALRRLRLPLAITKSGVNVWAR